LRSVDHVILGVTDLAAAARDYEKVLGFAVSAGGTHPGAGTYNRLIVLDPEYVELIARLPGHAAGETLASPVSPMFTRAPGTIGFALASDDIWADVEAIRERGVPVGDPREGRLDGPHGTGRGWLTARVDEDAALGLEPWRLPFVIQHDSSGEERLQRIAAPDGPQPHPNGARRLAHVTVAVHDLDAALDVWARVFGLESSEPAEDAMLHARTARLSLPQGAIVLAAPLGSEGPIARGLQAQGEGFFSVAIAVDDLQGAVTMMRGQGAGVRVEEPEGILVAARPDPQSAHGARLALVAAHPAGT